MLRSRNRGSYPLRVPDEPAENPSRGEPTAFAKWLASVIPAVYETDAALARAIGAPRSTVMRWRQGAAPSTRYLLRLSEVTGTNADVLLRLAGYRPEGGAGDDS